MKTRKQRIEEAIERSREALANGGDRLYYSRHILYLNCLLDKIEK